MPLDPYEEEALLKQKQKEQMERSQQLVLRLIARLSSMTLSMVVNGWFNQVSEKRRMREAAFKMRSRVQRVTVARALTEWLTEWAYNRHDGKVVEREEVLQFTCEDCSSLNEVCSQSQMTCQVCGHEHFRESKKVLGQDKKLMQRYERADQRGRQSQIRLGAAPRTARVDNTGPGPGRNSPEAEAADLAVASAHVPAISDGGADLAEVKAAMDEVPGVRADLEQVLVARDDKIAALNSLLEEEKERYQELLRDHQSLQTRGELEGEARSALATMTEKYQRGEAAIKALKEEKAALLNQVEAACLEGETANVAPNFRAPDSAAAIGLHAHGPVPAPSLPSASGEGWAGAASSSQRVPATSLSAKCLKICVALAVLAAVLLAVQWAPWCTPAAHNASSEVGCTVSCAKYSECSATADTFEKEAARVRDDFTKLRGEYDKHFRDKDDGLLATCQQRVLFLEDAVEEKELALQERDADVHRKEERIRAQEEAAQQELQRDLLAKLELQEKETELLHKDEEIRRLSSLLRLNTNTSTNTVNTSESSASLAAPANLADDMAPSLLVMTRADEQKATPACRGWYCPGHVRGGLLYGVLEGDLAPGLVSAEAAKERVDRLEKKGRDPRVWANLL